MSERTVLGLKCGVVDYWGHDNSVVVARDGEVLFAAEDERYTRSKHGSHAFPERTIEAALSECDLELADVDRIAVPYDPKLEPKRLARKLRAIPFADESLSERFRHLRHAADHFRKFGLSLHSEVRDRFADLGSPVPPIATTGHHRSHAVSAFAPSGFESALVVTLDSSGEYDSTVVWAADESGLERVATYPFPNSLGMFYSVVTGYLGYVPLNGEGKVMGLAPYGERDEDIERALRRVVTTGLDYDVTALTGGETTESGIRRLERLFDRPRTTDTETFSQWEKDLARVVQSMVEETVTDIVARYCSETGLENVAVAGGLGLNCKLNQRIRELPAVEEFFVQPVANDAGVALGAALDQFPADSVPTLETVYWGPEYPPEAIETYLQRKKLSYSKPDDFERAVAERLADGELVGWFNGRLEMGPRALGNRSIIADPRTSESRQRVNEYVKDREQWRPFAPSVVESRADEYFVDGRRAPFMIETFDVRPEKRDEIAAAIHPSDGTARPQTVTESQNPQYYRLLDEFADITGVPVLLNTSFNDHGEPIVTSPVQAISDFYSMGLDALAIEGLLVEK
ncbi:carbamoyltransferase [Halorussus caseinilyticus]|nr:carbamoyltransferase C-terminal domain-containing protein [Halorussus sp. DT72]